MNQTEKVNKWTVLSIVIISTFMATLDGSIVNVALPSMTKALKVSSSGIQFVATSYLIVIAGIILVFGKLGDMLSVQREQWLIVKELLQKPFRRMNGVKHWVLLEQQLLSAH